MLLNISLYIVRCKITGYFFLWFVFQNKKSHYVWHRREFDEINVKTTDRLMGGYRFDTTGRYHVEQITETCELTAVFNTHTDTI